MIMLHVALREQNIFHVQLIGERIAGEEARSEIHPPELATVGDHSSVHAVVPGSTSVCMETLGLRAKEAATQSSRGGGSVAGEVPLGELGVAWWRQRRAARWRIATSE